MVKISSFALINDTIDQCKDIRVPRTERPLYCPRWPRAVRDHRTTISSLSCMLGTCQEYNKAV